MFDMVQVLERTKYAWFRFEWICLRSFLWLSNQLWSECVHSDVTKHQFRLVIQLSCSIHHQLSIVKHRKVKGSNLCNQNRHMISQVCTFRSSLGALKEQYSRQAQNSIIQQHQTMFVHYSRVCVLCSKEECIKMNNEYHSSVEMCTNYYSSSRTLRIKPQNQSSEELACQPILHDTWRPNLCTKDQENPRDGIFVHGTCFQGPIFLLAITGSSQEMELKVV